MTSSTAAPKRSKIVSRGRALEKGHHIYYAVKLFDVQEVLDKFSDFSLAKAYYATILLEYRGCWCFKCKLHNMRLQT